MKKDIKIEVKEVLKNNNNSAQKKYLAGQKQLRVWMDADKFDRFKKAASARNRSMHRLINDFVDEYLFDSEIEKNAKRSI